MRRTIAHVLLLCACGAAAAAQTDDVHARVTHHFADSDGVSIHYVKHGQGPAVVLLHGFPDYWYTWRHQLDALAQYHTVLAPDLRGYNRSDQPAGVEHYAMPLLVGDVLAVLRDAGFERGTVVGHDWGAAVAWQVALSVPEAVERLVVLSVPHPAGFGRELATNQAQQADSQYARDFQAPDSHEGLTAAGLASWVTGARERERYVAAFQRSDFAAMMNYYRANYPRTGGDAAPRPAAAARTPPVRCPVLVLHGEEDRALHAAGHDGTWALVDADTTLVFLQQAGHFLQHDQPEKVTTILVDWLTRTEPYRAGGAQPSR